MPGSLRALLVFQGNKLASFPSLGVRVRAHPQLGPFPPSSSQTENSGEDRGDLHLHNDPYNALHRPNNVPASFWRCMRVSHLSPCEFLAGAFFIILN